MVPAAEKAHEILNAANKAYLSLATDQISKFFDAPFATYQSTFVFVWAVIFLASCTIFLTFRDYEVLSYANNVAGDVTLTLEGQRPRRARSIASASAAFNRSPIRSFVDLAPHDGSDHRYRGSTTLDLPMVTIGEVSSGRIAKRRASTSKTPKTAN
jgi:hypothetical protein